MKTNLFCVAVFAMLLAGAAAAQTPVLVTNKAGDAVPVKVVNDPAKRAYQIGVDVRFPGSGVTPTVPAGRMFVVEYVTGQFRTYSPFGAAPCRFMEHSYGFTPDNTTPIESYSFMPQLNGTSQGISSDISFLSISQPVSIHIAAGSPIGANFLLSPTCVAPYVEGRMVFSGYLVRDNN